MRPCHLSLTTVPSLPVYYKEPPRRSASCGPPGDIHHHLWWTAAQLPRCPDQLTATSVIASPQPRRPLPWQPRSPPQGFISLSILNWWFIVWWPACIAQGALHHFNEKYVWNKKKSVVSIDIWKRATWLLFSWSSYMCVECWRTSKS